jgi:hypothetical protein
MSRESHCEALSPRATDSRLPFALFRPQTCYSQSGDGSPVASIQPHITDQGRNGMVVNLRVHWVILLLAACYSTLLFLSDLLPFVDLPFHLGAAAVVRGYDVGGNLFSDYFSFEFARQPNVLHLWFCSRPIFPSVEFANKVYFSLYTCLLPISILTVIRQLRGNPWVALLSFLFLYNFNVHWGFVGYILAIPAVFFLFALVLRHLEKPDIATHVGIALGAFALFFIHVLGALFFIAAYGLVCLVQYWRDPSKLVQCSALLLPLLGTMAWWWLGLDNDGEQGLGSVLADYYREDYLRSLRTRALFFIMDNAYLEVGRPGLLFGAVMAASSAVICLLALVIERTPLWLALRSPRARPILCFVATASLCFFLLPEGLPGQWALNQRFSVFAVLGIIIFSSLIELNRVKRGPLIAGMIAVCAVHGALYANYFRDFERDTAGFVENILPDAGKERLAMLIIEPHYRSVLAYLHFSNYYIVRRQGIAVTRMVDFRFGTIRRKPSGGELPPAMMRFDLQPQYRGEYDDLDYLVVRGEIPHPLRDALHKFEETRRNGAWALFERRSSMVN